MNISKYIDFERITHSFKTAIACLIGIMLTKLIGFPADQWVVVTIIVVMCAQIYVGSVMQKAYLRFLGTLVGCMFAMITIVSFGESWFAVAASISISSFIFSYISVNQEQVAYAGTLGAVTTAIIMLGHTPTLTFAAERFLEISVGLLIATLVSQFILPIHARTHLRRAQARTLEQIRDYYLAAIMEKSEEPVQHHDLDESIAKSLIKQRQLAKESIREPLGMPYDSSQFMQTLYYEREILRATTFMHIAVTHIKHQHSPYLSESAAWNAFNQQIIDTLNILINTLWSKSPSDHVHIPSVDALKEETQKNLNTISADDRTYIDGLVFSAEILTNSLEKLAVMYQIPVRS